VGGAAANFLDVGGGAGAETISDALEVLTRDPAVRAVLVNIFGGITRCDLVAQGIVDALGSRELPWPMVVRLDGTNAPEGRAILAAHATDLVIPADTMLEAARRAVALAGRG
jgi:succinyl-CoA synthetase beta subunit